jgi:hypothetical protein
MSTANRRLMPVLIGLALAIGATSFAAAEGGSRLGEAKEPAVPLHDAAGTINTQATAPGCK